MLLGALLITRCSHPRASQQPPAGDAPVTAATKGFLEANKRWKVDCKEPHQASNRSLLGLCNSLISNPAENIGEQEVSTAEVYCLSLSIVLMASLREESISRDKTLVGGAFILTIPTPLSADSIVTRFAPALKHLAYAFATEDVLRTKGAEVRFTMESIIISYFVISSSRMNHISRRTPVTRILRLANHEHLDVSSVPIVINCRMSTEDVDISSLAVSTPTAFVIDDEKLTQQIATFKNMVQDTIEKVPEGDKPYWISDHLFKRVIRARKGDLNAAKKMYAEIIKFRSEKAVHTLLEKYREPEVLRRYFPWGFSGLDKEGYPVLVERIGTIDLVGIGGALGTEKYLEWVTWYVLLNFCVPLLFMIDILKRFVHY